MRASLNTRGGVRSPHAAQGIDGAACDSEFALEGIKAKTGPDENLLLVGKTGLSVTKSAPWANAPAASTPEWAE